MSELDLQIIVVRLHSPDPNGTLKELLNNKEYHDKIAIQRAAAFITQYGGKEAKALAGQLLSAMNLGTEQN